MLRGGVGRGGLAQGGCESEFAGVSGLRACWYVVFFLGYGGGGRGNWLIRMAVVVLWVDMFWRVRGGMGGKVKMG